MEQVTSTGTSLYTTARKAFLTCINEIGSTNLFLLLILALITFYPLLSGGFTTHDDVYMAISKWTGHTWDITKMFSTTQGRFNFLWSIPLFSVVYIFHNPFWYFFVKFGAFFVLLTVLYGTVRKLLSSQGVALISVVFFLSIIQNGWEHNVLTSFPFVYNFYAILFLASLYLFATALDQGKLKLAIVSGILYFFSLGTEFFVLFFPLYLLIVLSRTSQDKSLKERLVLSKQYIFSILAPLLIYVFLYMLWRHIFPSTYDGNVLNNFSILSAIRVIGTFSLTAFPLASLHLYTASGDPAIFSNLRQTLSEISVVHITKTLIVGFLFVRLLTKKDFFTLKPKIACIGMIASGIGIFLPNVLLGFNLKYQYWVIHAGIYSYLYTYFSFISAVVFLALLLVYLNNKSYSWRPKLRILFLSITVIIIMALSFVVEIRNQYLALDQKLAQRKWDLVDALIQSPDFLSIPNQSTVVVSTLLEQRGYVAVLADDWSKYIQYKTGKQVTFTDSNCVPDAACYMLVFRQQLNTDDQFIVFGKVRPDGAITDVTIYSMPAQSDTVVLGSFNPGTTKPQLSINGVTIKNIGSESFSAVFPQDNSVTTLPLQIAHITGNVNLNPKAITISHYLIEPSLRSFISELTDGIDFSKKDYPDALISVSGLSDHESWGRWTDAERGPTAKFFFRLPLPRRFTLEITANAYGPNIGQPIIVRVGSNEKTFTINDISTHTLTFVTDGSENMIEIIPPKPTSPSQIDPVNTDIRKLGIGFISLKITP